jgi:hypothetical protein
LKITSIVFNNFTNDSRVEKQARSLCNYGYDLVIVALWSSGLPKFEKKNGYEVIRLSLISSFLGGQLGKIFKFLEFSF